MKVGTQHGDSDEILRALSAFGVNNICSRLPSARLDEAWSIEGLSKLKERIDLERREVVLGRGRQRSVLALLLLHANEVVSSDRLIEALWGDAPPPTAAKTVQVYV